MVLCVVLQCVLYGVLYGVLQCVLHGVVLYRVYDVSF